jgi:hypothetical protein
MKRIFLLAVLSACASQAQTPAAYIQEAKQLYNGSKNFISRAAEKMPEENYSFKPTPEIRTYGQLIAHVADLQVEICSTVTGSGKKSDSSKITSKAGLVAALKASFEECDKAMDSLTEANSTDVVGTGFLKRTKLGLMNFDVVHNNEMYGTIAVYLRLKGIVPPSSEPRGR